MACAAQNGIRMEKLFDNSDFSRYRHCKTLFVKGCLMPLAEGEASAYRRSEYARLKAELFKLLPGGVDCISDEAADSFRMFVEALADGGKYMRNVCFVAGAFCAYVDEVEVTESGLVVYYTKTTPKISDSAVAKAAYIAEIAARSGHPLAAIRIATCNRNYVRKGAIEPEKLFKITDVLPRIDEARGVVNAFLAEGERLIAEPAVREMSVKCERPDKCEYFDSCAGVSRPCILDFHGIDGNAMFRLFESGVKSLDDLLDNAHLLRPAQAAMVRMYLTDDTLHVDIPRVRAFLEKLHYPMCFLDFEACQPALPLYDGTRPFMQIAFQYSLHVKRTEYSELEHYQFLPKKGVDPRPEMARRLFNQIPHGACVVVFSKGLECKVLNQLATRFKDYAHKLNAARNAVCDLQELFASRAVYSKAMLGSTSLKAVYPAMFPGDKSCDYSALDVHNGAEALRLFTRAQYEDDAKSAEHYAQLYTYCGKDTLSLARMVMLLQTVTGAEIGQRKLRTNRRRRREKCRDK